MDLCWQSNVLFFKMLSRLVITFLPRSKRLLISWLQSPSAMILEPPQIKSDTVSTVSPSISHEVMGPDAMILAFWMLSSRYTNANNQKNICSWKVITLVLLVISLKVKWANSEDLEILTFEKVRLLLRTLQNLASLFAAFSNSTLFDSQWFFFFNFQFFSPCHCFLKFLTPSEPNYLVSTMGTVQVHKTVHLSENQGGKKKLF